MKKLLIKLLPHVTLIVALIMLTLFVFDRFNRAMMFLTNDLTKWLLAVLAVLVITQSAIAIAQNRRQK